MPSEVNVEIHANMEKSIKNDDSQSMFWPAHDVKDDDVDATLVISIRKQS